MRIEPCEEIPSFKWRKLTQRDKVRSKRIPRHDTHQVKVRSNHQGLDILEILWLQKVGIANNVPGDSTCFVVFSVTLNGPQFHGHLLKQILRSYIIFHRREG